MQVQKFKKSFLALVLGASLVGALAVSGCASKKSKASGDEGSGVTDSDISSDLADSDSGRAAGLKTVNFGYDSALLDSEMKQVLRENAKVLKDNSSMKVQVEGHTDERGGIQYNIALGERRANSTRAYLIDQGVSGERLTTISYGEERPVDAGHEDHAWAKNRRANFRITEK